MSKIIKVIEQDIIFLSYDEPNAEKNYADLLAKVPWAKRVHGVKGSDAAHKACAAKCETEYFVTVDGDNIVDPAFLEVEIDLATINATEDHVFSWCGHVHVNGLRYGNGGLSCWSREFVNNMRTHEASNGSDETAVEFCFDPKYFAMHNCYSTTYPNGSAKQAWRAGFREGVKMCLDRGSRITLEEFKDRVNGRNYDHLCIWQSVGADVENGYWAMYGARLGAFMIMLEGWDHKYVQDFDMLEQLWDMFSKEDPEEGCKQIKEALTTRLGLPIVTYTAEQSRFFKHHYSTGQRNSEIMMTEIDVIRKIEGW